MPTNILYSLDPLALCDSAVMQISVKNHKRCKHLSRSSIPVLNASVFDIAEIAALEYENGSPSSRFNLIGVGVHSVSIETAVKHNPKMTEIVRQMYAIHKSRINLNGLSAAYKSRLICDLNPQIQFKSQHQDDTITSLTSLPLKWSRTGHSTHVTTRHRHCASA